MATEKTSEAFVARALRDYIEDKNRRRVAEPLSNQLQLLEQSSEINENACF